ncbi:MAG: ubiquinol-cytochrome c reductase iron-sulfur subunit [Acidobacteria bacterium]|nr:ubiquinol-cytochrome c reductase iron-sulfur subunit [Acidobacteriota bacterium]
MAENQGSSRRALLLGWIYGLGALMGLAFAVPAAIYLCFPPRSRKTPDWVQAGDLTQLDLGQPQQLTFRRTGTDGWKIAAEKATAWCVKTSDRDVIAFSPWCTHLGCAYHWDEQKKQFLCPCHGSVFGIDGKVLAGPAPRSLDRYEVKLENNAVWLGPVRGPGGTAL